MSIATLSTKDNVKLTKQLNKRFERPVYWNEFKTKTESKDAGNENLMRIYLDASFQGVERLFAFAFGKTDNGDKKVERNGCRKYFCQKYFLRPIQQIEFYGMLKTKSQVCTILETSLKILQRNSKSFVNI